ncbi:hypothetical protein ACWEU6_05175 [Streptosporangium sandarakinum]|uniref:hypothetical protein n=1 Tax=Streptosporangium sandarakinum TaxID=1260955 RepID=UPI0036C61E3A
MPSHQNPNCNDPRSDLTVNLPTDQIAVMNAEAAKRGCTVSQMVEEKFSHLNGRICPCSKGPS